MPDSQTKLLPRELLFFIGVRTRLLSFDLVFIDFFRRNRRNFSQFKLIIVHILLYRVGLAHLLLGIVRVMRCDRPAGFMRIVSFLMITSKGKCLRLIKIILNHGNTSNLLHIHRGVLFLLFDAGLAPGLFNLLLFFFVLLLYHFLLGPLEELTCQFC